MREYTNLNWPDGPYGAEFRPFGKPSKMLASIAMDWADTDSGVSAPVSASVVYLRIKPAQTLPVDEDTLSIGFRTTVVEAPEDVAVHIGLIDRCLVGARRHATILAGHNLSGDLDRLDALTHRRLPGVTGVREGWAARCIKGRGLATMVDTGLDLDGDPPRLDVPLGPRPVATPADAVQTARQTLQRCMAIAITAAAHTGRMTWRDTFRVTTACSWAAMPAAARVCRVSTSMGSSCSTSLPAWGGNQPGQRCSDSPTLCLDAARLGMIVYLSAARRWMARLTR